MATAYGTDVSGALIIAGKTPIWVNGALGWKDTEPMELILSLTPRDEGLRHALASADAELDIITYRFARDLLDAAILEPEQFVGEGDVQLSWEPDEFDLQGKLPWDPEPCLRLRTPNVGGQWRMFVLDGRSVIPFLTRTYVQVPRAQETTDVDGALAQLLAEDDA